MSAILISRSVVPLQPSQFDVRKSALVQSLLALKAKWSGPENKWFTGIALGHDPTENECLVHYELYGPRSPLYSLFHHQSCVECFKKLLKHH